MDAPRPIDLKRRLLVSVTAFALVLLLVASAVAVQQTVARIRADIPRTGRALQQLITDEVARSTSAFDRQIDRLSLNGLSGLGELVHFCARIEDLYRTVLNERCFGETTEAAAIEPHGLAGLLQRLVGPAAQFKGALGTYPGVKVAELTIVPNFASEASRLTRTLGGLGALTLGVLMINALVYWPVRRALAPTRELLATLERMRAGDLSARVAPVPLVELERIGQGVNHLAQRLQRTEAGHRELARRLIDVREDERRHLARELHDEFGQCLASINAEAGYAQLLAREQLPELQPCADAIARTTGHMMENLHTLLHHLRPVGLEEFGLRASLAQLCAGHGSAARGGCTATLHVEGEVDDLPDHLTVSLYRIVQESLTNATKHGRARKAQVWLTRTAQNRLRLRVDDDGDGLSATPAGPEDTLSGHGEPPGTTAEAVAGPASGAASGQAPGAAPGSPSLAGFGVAPGAAGGAAPASRPGGLGLLGMRERVLALGGEIEVLPRQPRGLRVAVSLPVEADASAPDDLAAHTRPTLHRSPFGLALRDGAANPATASGAGRDRANAVAGDALRQPPTRRAATAAAEAAAASMPHADATPRWPLDPPAVWTGGRP